MHSRARHYISKECSGNAKVGPLKAGQTTDITENHAHPQSPSLHSYLTAAVYTMEEPQNIGQGRLPCTIMGCVRSYEHRKDLGRHLRTQHYLEGLFKCLRCGIQIRGYKAYRDHLETKHQRSGKKLAHLLHSASAPVAESAARNTFLHLLDDAIPQDSICVFLAKPAKDLHHARTSVMDGGNPMDMRHQHSGSLSVHTTQSAFACFAESIAKTAFLPLLHNAVPQDSVTVFLMKPATQSHSTTSVPSDENFPEYATLSGREDRARANLSESSVKAALRDHSEDRAHVQRLKRMHCADSCVV